MADSFFNRGAVDAVVLAAEKKFLISAGLLAQNTARNRSRFLTGLWKNSVHYTTEAAAGDFGDEASPDGVVLTPDLPLTPPTDTQQVRVGSPLVYPAVWEAREGWLTGALDEVRGKLPKLAAVILGKEMNKLATAPKEPI